MSQKTAISTAACPPGTLAGGPIRTRFFDGMFLTQADLETEQRYWRLKRRLTNRALGEGVVWGLRLEWKPKKHSFALSPGYALDCCGNDLVVECPIELSEQQLWARADPSLRSGGIAVKVQPSELAHSHDNEIPLAAASKEGDVVHACVVLQYVECPEEARPVHRDACAGPTGYCEPSRIRESTRIMLVPAPLKPPPTPPEKFLEELYKWRDQLDPAIKNLLFPPQGSPPTVTASGLAPLSVRVTVPGASPSTTTIQVPASGSASATGTLQAQQSVSTTRPSGVVTFELLPSSGWSFTSGKVTDQARVVESVSPPAALSMYWALDLALEQGDVSATTSFDFYIEDVEVSETFGGSEHGKVRAHVTGRVTTHVSGATVTVTVDGLTVTTELAEVFEDADGQACLRELVPWGWTVDPANGSKIARTLVLSSLYAFLSEVVRRNSSAGWRMIAQMLYALGWYALFGVNPLAAVEEVHRKKLTELILALYKRWCEGFAYPGPHCTDEHHGVYLGCVELRGGAVKSFDMWQHRRHVVTGPLLGHWAQQLGIAPIDVIAGRFASAMCCLAGLPPITLPPFQGKVSPGIGEGNSTFHVGTVASVATFAKSRGAKVTWLEPAALSLRMTEAFTAGHLDGRPVDVLATKVPDGGSVAIAVPRKEQLLPSPKIRAEVYHLLRRGSLHIHEAGRDAVTDFVVDLLRSTPPTALLENQDAATTHKLAEAVAKGGGTVADVAEDGTDSVVVRAGMGDTAELRKGAADLVEHSERAVDRIVAIVHKVLGTKFDRSAFGTTEHQKALAEAIAGKVLPKTSPKLVVDVAARTAKG